MNRYKLLSGKGGPIEVPSDAPKKKRSPLVLLDDLWEKYTSDERSLFQRTFGRLSVPDRREQSREIVDPENIATSAQISNELARDLATMHGIEIPESTESVQVPTSPSYSIVPHDVGFTGSGGYGLFGITGAVGFTGSGGYGLFGITGAVGFRGASGITGVYGSTGVQGFPGNAMPVAPYLLARREEARQNLVNFFQFPVDFIDVEYRLPDAGEVDPVPGMLNVGYKNLTTRAFGADTRLSCVLVINPDQGLPGVEGAVAEEIKLQSRYDLLKRPRE